MAIDIRVENHGSLFLFRPETPAGETWIEEHVDPDAPRFGGALVCEHRYARELADGMISDGLELA